MEHGGIRRRSIVSIVLCAERPSLAYDPILPAAMYPCGKCCNRFALNEVFLCAGVISACFPETPVQPGGESGYKRDYCPFREGQKRATTRPPQSNATTLLD